MKTIAIVGGTGMLGQPVAQALLAEGFRVKIISRNIHAAEQLLGPEFEYAEANTASISSLKSVLAGCDAVHINLSGISAKAAETNQRMGTENIVAAAKQTEIKRITYLSGTTVSEEGAWFYDIKAKLAAEKSIKNSGIPYLIFCPSWLMESLPLFVNNGRASLFGSTTKPVKWVAAKDYARMVANSYCQSELINKRLYIHGNQAMTIADAVEKFCSVLHPGVEVKAAPIWLGYTLAFVLRKPEIKHFTALLDYYEKSAELGDAREANAALGAPATTLNEWCTSQAS